jgi:CRP/FNR family transcriptional regulator, cyclic AMP receptor protein
MELIGRMLDGSIPYGDKGTPPHGLFGFRISQDDKIDRLREVSLLEGCTRRQLRDVARIAEVREVAPGAVLTRKGERGDEFFLIVDGRARVVINSRKHGRLGPGDFFGEMSLLDGGPRSATVMAETAMRLLVIRRTDFARLMNDVPDLPRSLLAVLSRRLRQAEGAPTA